MELIINSVYFTHIQYDEDIESLQVNYSTGQSKTFDDVTKREFNELLKSGDLSNNLWKLIQKKLEEKRIDLIQVQEEFSIHPGTMHKSEIEDKLQKIDQQLEEVEKMINE